MSQGPQRGYFQMLSNSPRYAAPTSIAVLAAHLRPKLPPASAPSLPPLLAQDFPTEGVGHGEANRSGPSATAPAGPTAQGQQALHSAAAARASPATTPVALQQLLSQCVAFMQEQCGIGSETLVS